MSDTLIKVDECRAEALQSAVFAGGAASIQAAVESAVDAWLLDHAINQASDEALRKLWDEGLGSGSAGAVDFEALKAEARRRQP